MLAGYGRAQLHAALGDQHKDNLKALYVVHASLPARAAIAAMTLTGVGMSRRVWSKVVYVDSLAALYQYVPPSQVHVPQFVTDFDRGVR